MRVLQFSTHNEDCGIAKYQQQFIQGMEAVEGLYTEYFEYSPNQTKKMSAADFDGILSLLESKLRDFDVLHIQHELSFFKNYELRQIIDKADSLNKKIIVTVHTAPDAQLVQPTLGGFGPRSLLHYTRQIVSKKRFLNRYVNPLLKADVVVVHNESTKQNLIKYGLSSQHVRTIRMPVPVAADIKQSTQIKKSLNYKKGDIIYATVGFLSAAKGIFQAVKALNYLPDNYKLAIIGGLHPDAEPTILDELADLITQLHLQERVYITGFVDDDDELNALVGESDICVYPFNKKYYSFVSSASLNIAIASHKPVVAYHTASLDETNDEIDVVSFCRTANYYELARTLTQIDLGLQAEKAKQYANLYSWDKEAIKFVEIYRSVTASN
jgi:glycosyltransferase involved in cell wall biosynthesis